MGVTVTILLVEDEALLRGAFRTLLEATGYRVREAGTGKEARVIFEAEEPDLVLLDIGLPDCDGLEIAREFRGRAGSGLRIVALTGRSGPDIAQKCIAAGCVDHVVKPIAPRDLVRRIPGWLERPATDAPAETRA